MAKKLQLVFKTAAITTSTVSIENAKEGLRGDVAKSAAAMIPPVLTTMSGGEGISFEKAVLTTTTQEVLE